MTILRSIGWSDYALLDTGYGQRLERFGSYTLIRPDPQIIWKPHLPNTSWDLADAVFTRTTNDKGIWKQKNNIPLSWMIRYKSLSFFCKCSLFKHTGVFPEQQPHWDFIMNTITTAPKPVHVLNLFGYTGIATLAAASAGAKVTHVDASRSAIRWARENQNASGLTNTPIRWILDDAVSFVRREVKRGITYDAIIMDPPVYGHGPDGKRWSFNESFVELLTLCRSVLSNRPLFVIVNAYAISSSSIMLKNSMEEILGDLGGTIAYGELAIQEHDHDRLFSTGIFSRWQRS